MEKLQENIKNVFRDRDVATTREVCEALYLPFVPNARRNIEIRARKNGLALTYIGRNAWMNN